MGNVRKGDKNHQEIIIVVVVRKKKINLSGCGLTKISFIYLLH